MKSFVPTANYAAPNYGEGNTFPVPMYKLGDRVRTMDGRFDLARVYEITNVQSNCTYELDKQGLLVEQRDIILMSRAPHTGEPLFKVGDQFTLKKSSTFAGKYMGRVYIVKRVLAKDTLHGWRYSCAEIPSAVYEYEMLTPDAAGLPYPQPATKSIRKNSIQKPEACRNFWIEAEIDNPRGGKSILAGGPAGKDGGFTLRIKMRDQGEYDTALIVRGRYDANTGKLHMDVDGAKSRIESQRDRPKTT